MFDWFTKKREVVVFSSMAICLYGYDQGMMSLINTNANYLSTMGLGEESPMVGVIVSVYYLGCAVGAVLASWFGDWKGRKHSIFACLAMSSLGNLLMFLAGFGEMKPLVAQAVMLVGRIVMGLGVGGIDAVVPVYSSEVSNDDTRGRAMGQEFQANILGLNIAFALNVLVTRLLSKSNQWAWRIPIIAMQIFPIGLLSVISRLPESPRWLVHKKKEDRAREALEEFVDPDTAKTKLSELQEIAEDEDHLHLTYADMIIPGRSQFHPTFITMLGQINQALTGYGCVSVYGSQIFELLGFDVITAEWLTLANYIQYLGAMTFAWLLIDKLGRRYLMLVGSGTIATCFLLLTLFGGLAMHADDLNISYLGPAVPGILALYIATAAFGIAWLVGPWLIPTEIYPSAARAKGAAISVIVWGFANFAVTLLSPIGFNNLKYWLFLVFAGMNLVAGVLTWTFVPESGGRSFEENQEFFKRAKKRKSWVVSKVMDGEWTDMPSEDASGEVSGDEEEATQNGNANKATEETPLLETS